MIHCSDKTDLQFSLVLSGKLVDLGGAISGMLVLASVVVKGLALTEVCDCFWTWKKPQVCPYVRQEVKLWPHTVSHRLPAHQRTLSNGREMCRSARFSAVRHLVSVNNVNS